MKNGTLFSILLFFSGLIGSIQAQTASGGCSSVTVTGTPSYPTVYFAYVSYTNCTKEYHGEAGYEDYECCRVISFGSPTTPQFWLQKLDENGDWITVSNPQLGNTFSNLTHGTYRVKMQLPQVSENQCAIDQIGNIFRARIWCYNVLGQFIGFWGTWDNSPFSGPQIYYTNEVVVGLTVPADITYTFIDIPETGSEAAYDYGETAIMDLTDCNNFNLWWLAIFEDGPTYQRYKSNDWTHSSPDEFDLSAFWRSGSNWNFETYHTYTVQFAIENGECINQSWNNLDRTFFICPAGTGCRLGKDQDEIAIVPNPANSTIKFQNFIPDLGRQYQIYIADILGRQVKKLPLISEETDISDLQNGIFSLSLLQDNKQIFVSKLVVTH